MTDKIKLYVNEKLVVPDMAYSALLYPFWGIPVKKTEHYALKTWKHGFSPDFFELVPDIARTDYVLVPHDYWRLKQKHPEKLEAVIREAETRGKPILVDASGDAAGKVEVSHARILRINQYRFDLPDDEITVPVPCEDLLESYYDGKFAAREKKDVPVVGFVGWGKMLFKQRIRSLIKELPIRLLGLFDKRYRARRKGVFWRERAIDVFERSDRVKTNFLIRSSYSGHTRTASGNPEKLRREFVENIFDSDYTLIVRGDANAATRFYETLALGRIPVFIDTACVLPLENKINYRECAVFIDYADIAKAPDILADFHKNLTPEAFIAMQEKARYIFRHYLRYDAFSGHLASLLREYVR